MYLAGILVVILGIALSIGIHEIGHLVPAKLFGVKVKQYMIGFGPTVFSRVRGETEYGIKAIPLGGYILMAGMYPPERKPYRGPFANWINDARREVDKDSQGLAPERQFYNLTAPKKLTIMLGGPVMNLLLGALLIVTALSAIGPLQPSLEVNKVFDCVEGTQCDDRGASPAKLAGVQAGDEILAVAGTSVKTWAQALEVLKGRTGEVEFTLLRGGEKITLGITPVLTERQVFDEQGVPLKDGNGLPVTELRPIIGIQLGSANVPVSLGDSLKAAGDVVAGTAGFILDLPNQLYRVSLATLGLSERDSSGVVSIVGVGQIAGEVASSDGLNVAGKLGSLLLILGSLNIALFAFNLIPLLPLDGGHVLGAVYESAKRRTVKLFTGNDPGPIDTARALPIAYLVWLVLIAMGVLLILADLTNPIRLS